MNWQPFGATLIPDWIFIIFFPTFKSDDECSAANCAGKLGRFRLTRIQEEQ